MPSRREWQFDVFAWLLRNCGGYPKFLETTLVLPIEEHFPDRGMNGHAGVAALFRRVRDHAGMADWPCVVEPEPKDAARRARTPTAFPIITYKPGCARTRAAGGDVRARTRALPGRNLRGTGARRRGAARARDRPRGGVHGVRVFMANSRVENARYELNEGEFVHALALFCLLRKLAPERSPST